MPVKDIAVKDNINFVRNASGIQICFVKTYVPCLSKIKTKICGKYPENVSLASFK